ncbi:hypothetical protein M3J09_009159 [Ascochyta lentis]
MSKVAVYAYEHISYRFHVQLVHNGAMRWGIFSSPLTYAGAIAGSRDAIDDGQWLKYGVLSPMRSISASSCISRFAQTAVIPLLVAKYRLTSTWAFLPSLSTRSWDVSYFDSNQDNSAC